MLINYKDWYFEPTGCSLEETEVLGEFGTPTGQYKTKILCANGEHRQIYSRAKEVAKEINKLILEASISGDCGDKLT